MTAVVTAALVSSCATGSAPTSAASRPSATSGVAGSVGVSLDGWATVRVPRRWHVTPASEPAPVYFPLTFVGTQRLAPDCRQAAERCRDRGTWFAPNWTTPDDGVIALWSHAEFPSGPPLKYVSGRSTTIDGRPAKVSSDPSAGGCPAGPVDEIDAYVSAALHPERERFPSGERFDLVACFGQHASRADHAAVTAMVNSLRIVRPRSR